MSSLLYGRSLNWLGLLLTVKEMLGEQTRNLDGTPNISTTSEYWSDTELFRYINDAYIEAAKATKAVEVIVSLSTTADTGEYTLPDTVGQVIRVSYDDYKLTNVTKWELDRTESDWENQSGYVSDYITTQQNNRTIRLFKRPTVSGGIAFTNGEYGLVTNIDDGTNTYTFSDEYGVISDTSGTDWDGDFVGEYGLLSITGGVENEFVVWATKNPAPLVTVTQYPEMPRWGHVGIAMRAAAKALGKHGEQQNTELAAAYDMMAKDYLSLQRAFVSGRSGERLTSMGGGGTNRRRAPKVWDTLIVG